MRDVKIESFFDGDTTTYRVLVDGERKGAHWTYEDAKKEADSYKKEETTMKNNGQATNLTIEVSGQVYTMTRPGYYYTRVNGKQTRISKDEWESAFEIWSREHEQELKDKEAEKAVNKAKKIRKPKDVAHESNGITLTAKQVKFLKRLPDDDFFEHGLESSIWIDVFCDTVADEFSPMAVGAMVSTLKEKGLINVVQDKVNGKKARWMAFTDLGKKVAKELGLA